MSNNQLSQKAITNDEFRTRFLQAAKEDGNPDRFFDSFSYRDDLANGNYSQAMGNLLLVLKKCRSVDKTAYKTIHKGTPFYWLGTTAYLVNDYETAAFFFDAAVSEDLRAGADPITHPTPALHFIQIEGEPLNQAARQLVQMAQVRIEELISDYNARPARSAAISPLTLPEIRRSFLRPAVSPGFERWRSLATAFISFCLEWDFRNQLLDVRLETGTSEPFFVHLFKGCLLFESLLKANPKQNLPANATQLGAALQYLCKHLGIPANPRISADFPTVLTELSQKDDSIQSAIEITGKIRNSLGHDLGWVVSIDKIQYRRLFRMVTTSILHTLACLYGTTDQV